VGGINWRFADPDADGLIGFNFGKMGLSANARGVIAQLTANQGLSEGDVKKMFDSLCNADQVVLSVRDNTALELVAGETADSKLPVLPEGWKAATLLGSAMLTGNSESVDQAMQRIAKEAPLNDLTRLAGEKQTVSDFWAVGTGKLIGSQAPDAGVTRFALAGWTQERATSEVAFEFRQTSDVKTLPKWATALDGPVIDGNVIYGRMTMETVDDWQFAATPLGQRLGGVLVQVARYLPARDLSAGQTRPVIYGLDSGPREVKH